MDPTVQRQFKKVLLAQQPFTGGSVEFGGVSGELPVFQIFAVPLRR
ncbi:hypothetical protein ACFY0A_31995 [Streptomyces sp. NPDC001698]